MTLPPRDDTGTLGKLVPHELRELLRGHALSLSRPVWGGRHGRHFSRRPGVGHDFRDHRPYVAGDELRRLDWRAAARRDRLVLRQTEAEDELDLVLLVDASGGMDYGDNDRNKLRMAGAITGALAWIALRQGDRVSLAVGSRGEQDIGLIRPSSANDRLKSIARVLLSTQPMGSCPWLDLLATVAPRLPRRSLLVLLSDFIDVAADQRERASSAEREFFRGLAGLRATDHDVVLVQVLHRDELEFPWTDRRMLRVEDLRGIRDPVESPGAGMRHAYLERMNGHLTWLRDECERSGMVLHRLVTDESLATGFVALLARLAGQDPSAAEDHAEGP